MLVVSGLPITGSRIASIPSILKSFIPMLCLVCTAAHASTYYIAANGSDANNGSTKSSPWLHAPGMQGCGGNCAAKRPQAGDKFLLRGGDTWYGNESGSPTGLSWTWTWSGASENPIYIGVDRSWFTGSSWKRPILTSGNPSSRSAVGSCAHDDTRFSYVSLSGVNYVTFDNFEFTGLCWSSTPAYGSAIYLAVTARSNVSSGSNIIVSNNYFHGWTHTACGSGCDSMIIIGITYPNLGQGNQFARNVMDGSDTDGRSMYALYGDCYDFHENVVRYTANGPVCNNMHTFHDNLIEHISESFASPGMHSNAFEFNAEWNGNNFVYNNLVKHNFDAGSSGEVNVWVTPTMTDYYFNNVVFDIGGDASGNYWDVESGGTAYFYNNTLVMGNGSVRYQGDSAHANFYNNHFIGNGGTSLSSIMDNENGSTISGSNNVFQTSSQAASQGYTAATNYSPVSASDATVKAGANYTSACSATTQALCSDTTLAVSYDETSHSVTGPGRTAGTRPPSNAWSAGAYELLNLIQPATRLTARVE